MIPFYKRFILSRIFPIIQLLWWVAVIYLGFNDFLANNPIGRFLIWILLLLILGVNTLLLIRWSRCPHCKRFLLRTVIFAPDRTFACPKCGTQIIVE